MSLTEKYRPKDWDEVKGQEQVVSALKDILAKSKKPLSLFETCTNKTENTEKTKPPNMLFKGVPGTGKTTVAKIFTKHYGANFEEFNASDERGLDVIREKIKRLASLKMSILIYLNEADGLTLDAQKALKPIMEKTKNAVFILDLNDESKIIDPIKSRCSEFKFNPLSFEDLIQRLYEICEKEGVKITFSKEEKDGFTQIYNISCGDMRKAINELEKIVTVDKELNFKNILGVVGEATDKSFTKTNCDSNPQDILESFSKTDTSWKVEPTEFGETYSKIIEIKPHNSVAKGKMYKYGRIQETVDPTWIGLKAKITIFKDHEG